MRCGGKSRQVVHLADQQTIQNWVAESRAEIDSARLMVLHCADQIDRHGQYEVRNEVSLIKFHVAGVLQRVWIVPSRHTARWA